MRVAFLLLSFAAVASSLGGVRQAGSVSGSSCARRAPLRARAASRLSDSQEGRPDLDEYLARLWGSSEEELDEDVQRQSSIFEQEGDIGPMEDEERKEFALMYKLRKELGDADFKAIFGTKTVTGPPLLDGGLLGR